MANTMIALDFFQIILAAIAVGSTVVIAVLFRYVWKPQPEKIFEENLESTIKIIFQHLSLVDSYKESIFNYLDTDETSDMLKYFPHKFSKYTYDEIFRRHELISDQIKILSNILKLLGYIRLEQYLAILQYAASAYSFLYKISNEEYTIGVHVKTLEWHRYYAAHIIRLFGSKVPKNFKGKWNLEFAKIGGIDFISKPSISPGDVIGPEYNLHNSLLFYDPQNSNIMNKLNGITESLDNLSLQSKTSASDLHDSKD